MNDPNGWHHSERVIIQAREGNQVLVQYINRNLIGAQVMEDGPRQIRRATIHPWAWVPAGDVISDADVRRSA